MREVTVSVTAAAPPAAVWTVLTDWPRQREWMVGTRVFVAAGDGRSVGSRLLGFTGLGDVGFLDELEIVEWAPPRSCRVAHRGSLLRGSASFVVTPADAGCVITWTESLEPPFGPVGAIGLRLVAPGLAWGMRRSLRRLAALTSPSRTAP